MHRPEKWGILKFTTESRVRETGSPALPAKPAHDLAMEVYYAQRDFYKVNSRWARNAIELGWKTDALPEGVETPEVKLTSAGYSCSVSCQTPEGRKTWRVRQDRLLTVE